MLIVWFLASLVRGISILSKTHDVLMVAGRRVRQQQQIWSQFSVAVRVMRPKDPLDYLNIR